MSVITSMVKFLGNSTSLVNASNQAANANNKVGKSFQTASAGARASANSMKGLVGQTANLNKTINIFGASIRQIGQGLQNLGTTMTAFVTAPLVLAFNKVGGAVLDLDDQIIEVRKTTGIYGKELDNLKTSLLELSTSTPTNVVDLGQIAADAGRMGIVGKDLAETAQLIAGFTKVIDQVVVATDITAQDAVTKLGRIGNIFYDTSKQFVENVAGLGSAINELGQANAVTESEIVSATLRLAPAAAALGLTAEEALALGTSIASASASAERGGTQINAALSKLAVNAVKVAKSAGIAFDELAADVTENPLEAFMAVVEAIGAIEDPLIRVKAATDLFGETGAKAVNILGESFNKLAYNVALSRAAFDDATSLQIEFDRAMDSTKNQLKILGNTFNYLGAVIGDAVLPEITRLVSFLVPAMKQVIYMFDSLNDVTKISVVKFMLLAAATGPLLVAIGSLMFAVGIMITGITTGFTLLVSLVGPIFTLGRALLWLVSSPIKLFVTAIATAVSSMAIAQRSSINLMQTLVDLGNGAFRWGANLMSAFADGILGGISYVRDAILGVVNMISGFIRAKSPPEKGPLSQIEVWGKKLIDTYIGAFGNADFSAISVLGDLISAGFEKSLRTMAPAAMSAFTSVSSLAERAIKYVGEKFGKTSEVIASNVATMNEALSSIFATGSLSGLGAMKDAIGSLGSDFDLLVRLKGRFIEQEKQLKALQEERAQIDPNLKKEIAAISKRTDLSVQERAEMIRSARIKAAAREADLASQEDALAKEKELTSESISNQEDLINAVLDQVSRDTESSRSSSEKSSKDKKEDSLTPIDYDIQGVLDAVQSAKDGLKDMFNIDESAGSFIQKMADAKKAVDGFLAGLKGGAFEPWELEAAGTAFTAGFKKGESVRETVIKWLDRLTAASDFLGSIGGVASASFNAFGVEVGKVFAKIDAYVGISSFVDYINSQLPAALKVIEGFIAGLQGKSFDLWVLSAAGAEFTAGFKAGEAIFDKFSKALDAVVVAVKPFVDAIAGATAHQKLLIAGVAALVFLGPVLVPILAAIAGGLLALISPMFIVQAAIVAFAAAYITNFNGVKTTTDRIVAQVVAGWNQVVAFFAPAVGRMMTSLDGLGPGFMDTMRTLWNSISDLMKSLIPVVAVIIDLILNTISAISPFVVLVFESVVSIFSSLIDVITGIIETITAVLTGDWGGAAAGATKVMKGVVTAIREVLTGLVLIAAGIVVSVMKALTDTFSDLTGINNAASALVTAVYDWFVWLFDVLVGHGIVPDLVEAIVGLFTGLYDSLVIIAGNIYRSLWSKWLAIKGKVLEVVDGLIQSAKDKFTDFVASFDAVVQSIKDKFNLADWAAVGLGIVDTIVKGISDNLSRVTEKLKDLAKGAIAAALGGLGIPIPESWKQSGGTVSGRPPGRASGDRSWRGGMVMVGEAGRELVSLPVGSEVFSNFTTEGMMGTRGFPSYSSFATGGAGFGGGASIVFSGDMYVRSDSDIDSLARKISSKIAKSKYASNRMG